MTCKRLPGELDGGDVLVLSPEKVILGIRNSASLQAAVALKGHLDQNGIGSIPLMHHDVHADCCCAPLPPRKEQERPSLLVKGKGLTDADSTLKMVARDVHEIILCDGWDDPRTCPTNILWINPETAISTTSAKNTNKKLRKMGYKIVEVKYDEMLDYDGGIRCSVAPLERKK